MILPLRLGTKLSNEFLNLNTDLRVILDEHISWYAHIKYVITRAGKRIGTRISYNKIHKNGVEATLCVYTDVYCDIFASGQVDYCLLKPQKRFELN